MIESLIQFFETIPPAYRTGILVTGLLGFWILEGAVPMFSFKYEKVKHALLNIFFTLTTMVVNLGLAFLIVKAADFTTANQFGLLYLVDLPIWAHLILAVMLLDLVGAWLIHWIEHKIKFLWKFHLIHHSDTHVDVTTALRHHPGESIFRASFTTLGIIIAGVPIGMVFVYQTLSAIFAQLTHANVQTPKKIDRLLSYVFVTPAMHKVHHHYVQPLTDTNYGNIFAIWDRIFGTFAEVEDSQSIKYGIDTHMKESEHSSIMNLLAIPFQKYRPPTTSKFGSEEGQAEEAENTK